MKSQINEGEIKFCEWQLGMTGNFYTKLIEAMMRADGDNQEKLRLAYPYLMQAVISYQNVDGYWSDLKNRYETKFNLKKKLLW